MAFLLAALAAAARIPQDSAAVLPSAPADSILGRLPAGIHPADTVILQRFAPAPIVQWLFQKPPWVMWGGALLALVIAAFILRWLWPRLPAIWAWWLGWSRPAKLAFFASIGVVLLVAGLAGYKGYDYMMNDSRFCTGCHIFMPPGQTVQIADTGNYTLVSRLSGKHDTLNCHTCHEFHPMSEARKMVFWMSGVRFTEEGTDKHGAPAHGYVPRNVCESCHLQGAAKETWQAVAVTAGHRLHLESDSASGKLLSGSECLTCHARTAHVFNPTDSTCTQKGCHFTDSVSIKLGRMKGAVGVHCTMCHEFAQPVPALASLDSASQTLSPAKKQCMGCHKMQEVLPDFDLAKDPHQGQCGTCHNPHTQVKPEDAVKSCASAQCHADWRQEPFHLGKAHIKGAEKCLTCHTPHAAKVDASDCEGCHTAVRERTAKRPPLPFDTTAAKRRVASAPPAISPSPPRPVGDGESPHRGKGDAPPEDESSGVVLRPAASPIRPAADSFPHQRHTKLACITCHQSNTEHGQLTFDRPRGCDLCHHQAPATSKCDQCHGADELAEPHRMNLRVQVPKHEPRDRPVDFEHSRHVPEYRCQECHTTPVTMALPESRTQCRDCHGNHHTPVRNCSTCHSGGNIRRAHDTDDYAHARCDACHTASTVEILIPTRNFCSTCHASKRKDHHVEKECTVCHFLAEPGAYRRNLTTRRAG